MKTTEELKNLLYKNETVADAAPDAIAAAQDFCEATRPSWTTPRPSARPQPTAKSC